MKQDKLLTSLPPTLSTNIRGILPTDITLTDDTRTLNTGDVLVWDERVKPVVSAKVIAEAKAKKAIILSNVKAEGVTYLEEPGIILAAYAAQTWPKQPAKLMGVTGTSGKTSTAWFGQQLAQAAGMNSASIGTLGTVRNDKVTDYSGYTSPAALQLHPILQGLAEDGVTHAVMEISSHALALHRADGARLCAAGITNVTQDHFDFHGDYPHYFAAKARLFSDVLPADGTAVLNIMRPELWPLAALCKGRGLAVLNVGTSNAELVVEVVEATAQGLNINLKYEATPVPVTVPLVGAFQAENLAVSLGLLLASGIPWSTLSKAVNAISSVAGRMEIVRGKAEHPTVVVDYAHKPDALKRALESLRPLADKSGGKLWVVFGCGGNRDATKRPIMGKIAAELADVVVVTDDNPRKEDAATVRAAIMAGVTDAGGTAKNIGDRRTAIHEAIASAGPNDIILVAGKGHEDGQIVGDETLPFDDRVVVGEVME